MEFKYPINELFRQPITEINHTLIPPGFTGDRRAFWDVVGKVSEVVNVMGEASAAAQGLTKPITTSERLRNSEHTIYFLVDQNAAKGKGAVTGMLKVGKKGLYVFDRNGQHYQLSPPCVLDFYIHESRQRTGLGKRLYEHMLQAQNVEPVRMAIDRPSEKFLGFLNKHYSLSDPVKQMNNYVVFDGFFPSAATEQNDSAPRNYSGETVAKKQSANGLQTTNFISPLGRYGAPRPTCSMGQIIHNQSSALPSTTEQSGVNHIKSAPVVNYQQDQSERRVATSSSPNIHYHPPHPQTLQTNDLNCVDAQKVHNEQISIKNNQCQNVVNNNQKWEEQPVPQEWNNAPQKSILPHNSLHYPNHSSEMHQRVESPGQLIAQNNEPNFQQPNSQITTDNRYASMPLNISSSQHNHTHQHPTTDAHKFNQLAPLHPNQQRNPQPPISGNIAENQQNTTDTGRINSRYSSTNVLGQQPMTSNNFNYGNTFLPPENTRDVPKVPESNATSHNPQYMYSDQGRIQTFPPQNIVSATKMNHEHMQPNHMNPESLYDSHSGNYFGANGTKQMTGSEFPTRGGNQIIQDRNMQPVQNMANNVQSGIPQQPNVPHLTNQMLSEHHDSRNNTHDITQRSQSQPEVSLLQQPQQHQSLRGQDHNPHLIYPDYPPHMEGNRLEKTISQNKLTAVNHGDAKGDMGGVDLEYIAADYGYPSQVPEPMKRSARAHIQGR